jgi:hypothetical protein
LLFGELILDAGHQRELRMLDVALERKDAVDLLEESRFVDRRTLKESLQLLALSTHLELEIDEPCLRLPHRVLDCRALAISKADGLLVRHHELGRK